jgi:basic membrane protein A and related proteins
MSRLSIVVLMVLALLLAACAPTAAPAPAAPAAPTAAPAAPTAAPAAPTAAPAAEGKGSIAVVLPGPRDDNSWNTAAYNALMALKEKGVKVAYSENITDADSARVIREYAGQGFEMIVAHSFGYQDSTFQVAAEQPKTNFAWAGGINKTADNVADYDQPFYQAYYPIGVLAANMSKTGKIGALYGFDIPVCHSMGEAFLAGAKSVNPDIKLISTAVGDWVDVAKAKEAALAQADAGVDFWIECGEGPALGSIEAAKDRGGYVTGYANDMSANGPNSVLISMVWALEPLFQKMLDDTHNGTFKAPWYTYGLAEGTLQLKYNDALKDKVPADVQKAVEQSFNDIKSGKFTVPYVPAAAK